MFQDCSLCSSSFEITEDDLIFYDKVSPIFNGHKYSVPSPKLCPRCRQQRRLAWRNEQNLYRRSCDLCKRATVSVHPEVTPYPVYCVNCFWSDGWDAEDFGIEFYSSKPFLEQFSELQKRVPQIAIQNDNGIASENSEYCYDISRAKNCYRVVGSWYMEECYYSLNVNRSKYLADSNTIVESELVYESLDSQRLYRCAYLENSEGCSDCYFGYDLKGCKDCFGCYGLRQKQFHVFNEPQTEAEYREKLKALQLGSFEAVSKLRSQFDEWALKMPRRAANIRNCEDSVGNNLFNCKAVHGYSVFNGEYSKFIDRADGPKNSYDLINTGAPQWCYDCVTPDDSYLVLFSVWCWKSKNILYSDNCHSSENLCGCISLRRKQHSILNKRYSKEDYETKMGQILADLSAAGSWGEHLPIELSPFAYNETAAHEYYPLSAEQVIAQGWRWSNSLPDLKGKETIELSSLADNIEDVSDDIINEILACSDCSRNYKITAHELDFYRRMSVPLPRQCPGCRHLKRFSKKAPTTLWHRSCDRCKTSIQTTYSDSRSEIVYCDTCYFAEIY